MANEINDLNNVETFYEIFYLRDLVENIIWAYRIYCYVKYRTLIHKDK